MDFKQFLPDEKALKETREQLYFVRNTLHSSLQDYAKLSLDGAEEAFRVAINSGLVLDTYDAQSRYVTYSEKYNATLNALNIVNQGILNLEETSNPSVDSASARNIEKGMKSHYTNAFMEAAHNRMNAVMAAIPDKIVPGTRCNGKVFVMEDSGEGDHEDEGLEHL